MPKIKIKLTEKEVEVISGSVDSYAVGEERTTKFAMLIDFIELKMNESYDIGRRQNVTSKV